MIFRSSIKRTVDHVAESVFLGRGLNRNPDHHWVNSIHVSNNDKLNKEKDPTNLGDCSLSFFLDVVQDAANFKTNLLLLIIYQVLPLLYHINVLFLLVQHIC